MSALLEIRQLRKVYGGLVATNDVTLNVETGAFHALIGPNGAGKTTLIAQLFGEVRPTSGRIAFDGIDMASVPVHARAGLGMARSFQITTLARDLSALENVLVAIAARAGHALRFWRPARHDQTLLPGAMRVLDSVGLAARADDPVAHLSHGEQRMLELGIALAENPKLVLLDEPMAGLGPAESRVMTDYLRGLHGHVTVLLVEHDMEAVFSLADRITVLVRGSVIATGTPDDIRGDQAVRAAYLGEEN